MISLVIWFGGAGFIYDERASWDDCQRAMDALISVNVDATCHLVPKEDRR